MGCVCIEHRKTPVATLGFFLFPILSKALVALASSAFSALFATVASKALAHGCVVRELTLTSEKGAG